MLKSCPFEHSKGQVILKSDKSDIYHNVKKENFVGVEKYFIKTSLVVCLVCALQF